MAAVSELREVVEEGIDIDQDLVALARLVAIKSLNRNLRTEDQAVQRDYERAQREFEGGQDVTAEPKEEDEPIEVTVAHGDVHIYERPKDKTPVPPVPTPPASGGLSGLAKLAIGAGLATSIGLGLAAYFKPKPSDTVINKLDDTQTGIKTLPPVPPNRK